MAWGAHVREESEGLLGWRTPRAQGVRDKRGPDGTAAEHAAKQSTTSEATAWGADGRCSRLCLLLFLRPSLLLF